MTTFVLKIATGLLLLVAAPAGARNDVASQVINKPAPADFSVYGLPAPATLRDDDKVQGGKALRVVIPGADKDVWKIGLVDPIIRPVKAGDKIVLAFYARVVSGPDSGKTAVLPNNSVQLSKEPYTGMFGGSVTLGSDWKMYNLVGKADHDYAAGELNVQLQLASGAQTLDFGPMFVLDLGPQ